MTNLPLMLLDGAVGVSFIVGAAVTRGPAVGRLLWAAVGFSWIAGELPALRPLHQALLLVALASIARLHRRVIQVSVALVAVPVSLGLLSQVSVAATFALLGVAIGCCAGGVAERRVAAVAAITVAVVLGGAWAWSRLVRAGFDPVQALAAYQLTLLLIAFAYPIAVRYRNRTSGALADRVLASEPSGTRGLEEVLRVVLRDPQLRVLPVDEADGVEPVGPARRGRLLVVDGPDVGRIAVVCHQSAALEDPVTAAAVADAVRLTVTQESRQVELQKRLSELQAARSRMLAAADLQRKRAATELGEHLESLEAAQAEVRSTCAGADAASRAILGVVVDELALAAAEIAGLVRGVPPAELGGGGLMAHLLHLTGGRSPVPVSVHAAPNAVGDPRAESALYYVCSEALANALKHADARFVQVDLRRSADELVLTVSDDGSGGADPSGSGLVGLADRLATVGGRLQVRSSPGAGTTVRASVPLSRSWSTAGG